MTMSILTLGELFVASPEFHFFAFGEPIPACETCSHHHRRGQHNSGLLGECLEPDCRCGW